MANSRDNTKKLCSKCSNCQTTNNVEVVDSQKTNICQHNKNIETDECDACNERKLWQCKYCKTINDYTWYDCQRCDIDRFAVGDPSSNNTNTMDIDPALVIDDKKDDTPWIELKPCPISNIAKPARINRNSLLICGKTKTGCAARHIPLYRLQWILKYNLDEDKWSRWSHNPYSNQFKMLEGHHLATATDTNYLFISNSGACGLKINTHTKEWSKLHVRIRAASGYDQTCLIEDKLHYIENGNHLAVDLSSISNAHMAWRRYHVHYVLNCHYLPRLRGKTPFGFVYVKRLKMALLFIGSAGACDAIWAHYTANDVWAQLIDVVIPEPLQLVGYTLAADERYIFIATESSHIYAFDLDVMEFKQCNVNIPMADLGVVHLINHRNREKEKQIVFGYIRMQWQRKDISQLVELPYYLIRIINEYFSLEYLHLLHKNTGKHCKIPISRLI